VEHHEGVWPYTDDSALTFALAESLLFRGGLDLDHLAVTFAVTYQRDPHRGYGAGAAQLLRRLAAGDDWRLAAAGQFGGRGSFGNGAAMRAAPIALHAHGSVDVALRLGRESATVTHTHPEGVDGAGVQAAAVALALAEPPATGVLLVEELCAAARTPRLRSALERVVELPRDAPPADVASMTGTGVRAAEAVPAAVAAARLNPGSFPETIRFAIAMGGDVDTIASMAGAISGAARGEGAIPASWLDRTEGVHKARELADRFAAEQARKGRGLEGR